MPNFITSGKVKELIIKVMRKEMTYDEMASLLENQIIKKSKNNDFFKVN
jgi:hypothetical protein